MAVLHSHTGSSSIVDVLLGRFQHVPTLHVSPQQRLYHNYRAHEPSLRAESGTSGQPRTLDLSERIRPRS
jgi:hypothetical protein